MIHVAAMGIKGYGRQGEKKIYGEGIRRFRRRCVN
jgi:hypothetical protein